MDIWTWVHAHPMMDSLMNGYPLGVVVPVVCMVAYMWQTRMWSAQPGAMFMADVFAPVLMGAILGCMGWDHLVYMVVGMVVCLLLPRTGGVSVPRALRIMVGVGIGALAWPLSLCVSLVYIWGTFRSRLGDGV